MQKLRQQKNMLIELNPFKLTAPASVDADLENILQKYLGVGSQIEPTQPSTSEGDIFPPPFPT